MTIRIVQRITDSGLKLVGVLLAWLGLTLALPLTLRAGAQVDVYFPSQHLLTNLPDDVSVVDWGRNRITLTGERRDLALSLYRAGAMIVLPAGGGGCVDLRKKRSS
jgi:hypothetical protein